MIACVDSSVGIGPKHDTMPFRTLINEKAPGPFRHNNYPFRILICPCVMQKLRVGLTPAWIEAVLDSINPEGLVNVALAGVSRWRPTTLDLWSSGGGGSTQVSAFTPIFFNGTYNRGQPG